MRGPEVGLEIMQPIRLDRGQGGRNLATRSGALGGGVHVQAPPGHARPNLHDGV